MLRNRLIFGALMTVALIGLVLVDGWLDGTLTAGSEDDRPVRGIVLVLLVFALLVPAYRELRALMRSRGIYLSVPIGVAGSGLLTLPWCLKHAVHPDIGPWFLGLLLVSLIAIMAEQYWCRGIDHVMVHCGAGCLALLYLGIPGSFAMAVRVDFGPWALLIYALTVKGSDIGAYTAGRLFGRHKLAPRLSPAKTWEGLCGAVVLSVVVSVLLGRFARLDTVGSQLLFGVCFGILGQLSDLAESMLKRDAGLKDSSDTVPGFGGILDVLDSLLMPFPFAYGFYCLVAGG